MVQCSNCGTWIADDQQFCPQCGAPKPTVNLYNTSGGQQAQPASPPQPASAQSQQMGVQGNAPQPKAYYGVQPPPQEEPNKKGCWLWGGIGCLVVVVLFACATIAGYFYYNNYVYSPIPTNPIVATMFTPQIMPTQIPAQPTVPSTSPPSPTQIQPTDTIPTLPKAEFNGISFFYDKSIANNSQGKVVPADIQSGNEFWSYPEHIAFDFQGYVLPQTFHDPVIAVYPVDAYQAINPSAIDIIAGLKNLLATKPPTATALPFLPVFNAGQMIQAKIDYFDFKNGSGVRYLTEFSQSYAVINNFELIYTYQGLTSDEKYYVSAILPISHPSLPPNGDEIPGGDYDDFIAHYEQYITDTTNALNGQPPESFTPSIIKLDQMLKSLNVTQ
jgi:hypothetical protein